jgi:hypothetical protein
MLIAQLNRSSSNTTNSDLDLDTGSLWFTRSPPAFPPRTIDKSKYAYSTSSGWSQQGARVTHTFSAIVQSNATLARSKIYLTWDKTYPEGVKVQQRHYPPPPELSGPELESNRQR